MIEVPKNMKYCVHNIFSTKYLLVLITCMLFVNYFSIDAHVHLINWSEKSRKKNKTPVFIRYVFLMSGDGHKKSILENYVCKSKI